MKSFKFLTITALLALLLPVVAQANGPMSAIGTVARVYAASSLPLTYRTDQGGLGAFSNTVATSITVFAFTTWDTVSTASLSFLNGGTLSRNVTSATDAYISGANQFSDGVNPVVFDSSGAITDGQLGSGASNSVLGYAASDYSGANYTEGFMIINGKLSGNGNTSMQDEYKATITHELGHFLGLSHAQNTMHSDYATMYPIIWSNNQRTLEPDEVASISMLYPGTNYLSSVGSISGTVKRPSGAILSGVNVIAIDSVTGNTFSTVTDYYSGGRTTFTSPPTATGSYSLQGLPPGVYFVHIQPIKTSFTGGSLIASYQNGPSGTSSTVMRDWWNGANESGNSLLDNINDMTGVVVTAGQNTPNINIVNNESATTSVLSYSNGNNSTTYSLPSGTYTQYATRFTSPSIGSLVSVKFRFEGTSTLPQTGTLTITVYSNATGSLAGIPGGALGSVTIPFKYLSIDMDNEVWLRGLGTAINFNAATDFHIGFSSNNAGSPKFYFDNGSPTQNRSSYYTSAAGWRNFPQGITGGAGYNMIATCVYSTQQITGPPSVNLSLSSIDFGKRRVGATYDQNVVVTNGGTDTLKVPSGSIGGANSSEFAIIAGAPPFNLPGGTTRTITIRFTPQSIGAKVASLTLTSNAAGSPTSVPITGTGSNATASLIQASVSLGTQQINGTYNTTVSLLRNTGNDTLHITGSIMAGADGGTGIRLTSNQTVVLPDSVYRATFRFLPTERRSYLATLTVTHDDLPNSPQIFTISGAGAGAELNVSGTVMDFGSRPIGMPWDSTMVIRNTGDSPMSLTGLTISGAASSRFTIIAPTGLPDTVLPGDSVVVQLRFQPTQISPHTAVLNITTSAGNATVSLSGAGINSLSTDPQTLNFDSVKVGVGKTLVFSVTNSSIYPLGSVTTGLSGANAAEFSTDAGGGFPLAAAGSKTIRVTLNPQTLAGNLSATVDIQSGAMMAHVNLTAIIYKPTGSGGVLDAPVTGGLRLQLMPVSPNPVRDLVEILWTATGTGRLPVKITVADLLGRTIATVFEGMAVGTSQNRAELDLKEFSSGDYMLILQSGAARTVEKFVVRK